VTDAVIAGSTADDDRLVVDDDKLVVDDDKLVVGDDQWSQAVETHLRRISPSLLPGSPTVQAIHLLAPDVWLLDLDDGGRVVAKHQFYGLLTRDESFDLLQTELDVLRHLRRSGASVPVPFGIDPEGQFIFLEFLGNRTLLDTLEETGTADPIRGVVTQQLCIEQLLADTSVWRDRVIPGGRRQDLARSWKRVEAIALRGLAEALTIMGSLHKMEMLIPLVHSLHERAGRMPPVLGATDYQPRNVMCIDGGRRVAFLELGKLGWDWTERRALQYTTPLESSRLPLAAKRAFLQELATSFPGNAARRALDIHHLFFRLVLAAQDPRKADLELLLLPLSDEPTMASLRHHLNESCL
jgi:hypothetical protein